MTFTISFGWWLLPLAVTILAWVPFMRWTLDQSGSLPDIGGALLCLVALLGSCFAWMLYFGIGWALA